MKVKFILSPEIVGDAKDAVLLGDFNNWDPSEGIGLKVQKDGSLAATVALEPGKTYQYRYFLSDGRWVNDNNAAEFAHNPVFQVDNCVITVPAEKIKAEKAEKAPKAVKTEKAEKAPKVEKTAKVEKAAVNGKAPKAEKAPKATKATAKAPKAEKALKATK